MTTLRRIQRQTLRRLLIHKQHLHAAPPLPILSLIEAIGCLQLDPISMVERTHLLVLWSRLGNFDRDALERLLWQDKHLFEYWAHAASIVLMRDYPVHRAYMRQQANNARWHQWLAEHQLYGLLDHLRQTLRTQGASLSRHIETGEHDPGREKSPWWGNRYTPLALEYLWLSGELMVVGRDGKQRIWGLSETALPDHAPQQDWEPDQITRYAAQAAILALGAATSKQIKAHYIRSRYAQLEAVLKQLIAEGTLEQVEIWHDGQALKGTWVLHTADLPLLEQIERGEWQGKTTLLSPFDNLICDRDRTEALFDFYYRIELYTPALKRQYGYYVMPILHHDALVGRVDPRYDRATQTLHIQALHLEPGVEAAAVLPAVRQAAEELAAFLGASALVGV